MFNQLKDLHGYKIRATDGDLGSLREMYFDDHEWSVRYFVIDTGGWLVGRKVLIAPKAITGVDTQEHALVVNLTREHVKNSPDISTDTPVTRRHEVALSLHYGWPEYWSTRIPFRPGMILPIGTPYGFASSPPTPGMTAQTDSPENKEVEAIKEQSRESTLCSSHDVAGYHMATTDGDIGHIDDFIIDSTTWYIRYLIVDTGGWLNERKVLIAPEWIESISWDDSRVYANLSRKDVSNGPEYDPRQALTREYESRLFDSYHRPKYWELTQDDSQNQHDHPR